MGICPMCQAQFKKRRESHIYCSYKCSGAARRKVNPCSICGSEMGPVNKRFCSKKCESANNRKNRPSDEWLREKYINEGMTCPQIAKLLSKDPKTIYTWMKDADIPTRGRGEDQKGRKKGYSFWRGKKLYKSTREKIKQKALEDGRVPYLKNGKHWLKGRKGAASPNYKGGITPERQQVYGTPEWKQVANQVWRRDRGKCQRCGIGKYEAKKLGRDLDIHHIVSFAVKELRLELSNLTLLCEKCHYWVHSSENTGKEFIKDHVASTSI